MGTFLVALALGAAVIAVWIHVRFEHLAPEDFRGALIHCGVALGAGWFFVPALITGLTAAGINPMLVLFGLALPSLVYLFLAALWLLRETQALLLRR
jgi:hypothetical protein